MFACRNLNLSYKGNKILKDIHFHIPEGTVFCITGESGSGKSSLLKVINGIIPEITEAEISGEIKLNDMRLNEMDIAQRSRYISTVYQNPKTQFYCVESTDELAFPLENRNLPKDEMVKIIKKYTELLDTEKLLNRNIFSLSGGEKQLMAITSVMTMDNQVYLFDEPSASLDHHSIGLLKKCIAELKRKGKIVIIAEHRLYYLKEIMDYLAVLKEGKLEMISVEDLDHDKICRLKETYALRSFEEIRKEELLSDNPCYQIQMLNKTKNGEKDKNILKCKNFAQSFKNTKIMDIGEIGFSEGIYFIIGENGVGKSTFIKKMAKLLKGKGKSFYCGNEIKRSYEYISMVMQDVNYQIFTESVWSEISIVSQDDAKKERVLKELMLYDKKDSHPQSLSGGEKQRLMIALAIVSLKPIVILDEPTSGLCKGQIQDIDGDGKLDEEEANNEQSPYIGVPKITAPYEGDNKVKAVVHLNENAGKGNKAQLINKNGVVVATINNVDAEENGIPKTIDRELEFTVTDSSVLGKAGDKLTVKIIPSDERYEKAEEAETKVKEAPKAVKDPLRVVKGKDLTEDTVLAKKGVENSNKMPGGTTYRWKTAPNTSQAGNTTGIVSVTVPDREEAFEVTVSI